MGGAGEEGQILDPPLVKGGGQGEEGLCGDSGGTRVGGSMWGLWRDKGRRVYVGIVGETGGRRVYVGIVVGQGEEGLCGDSGVTRGGGYMWE